QSGPSPKPISECPELPLGPGSNEGPAAAFRLSSAGAYRTSVHDARVKDIPRARSTDDLLPIRYRRRCRSPSLTSVNYDDRPVFDSDNSRMEGFQCTDGWSRHLFSFR